MKSQVNLILSYGCLHVPYVSSEEITILFGRGARGEAALFISTKSQNLKFKLKETGGEEQKTDLHATFPT